MRLGALKMAALIFASLLALSLHSLSAAEPQDANPAAPQGAAGMHVYIDPETGEFYDEATTKAMLMDLAKAVQGGKLDPEWLNAQAAKSKEVTGYDILEVMRRVA